MSNESDITNFTNAWIKFVEATQLVLEHKRHQPIRHYVGKHYWEFATATLAQMKSPAFINEIKIANLSRDPKVVSEEYHKLLYMELVSYSLMVNTIIEQSNSNKDRFKRPSSYKDALGIAKTIIESLKDILGFSDLGKSGLKIYCELIDIFKGS